MCFKTSDISPAHKLFFSRTIHKHVKSPSHISECFLREDFHPQALIIPEYLSNHCIKYMFNKAMGSSIILLWFLISSQGIAWTELFCKSLSELYLNIIHCSPKYLVVQATLTCWIYFSHILVKIISFFDFLSFYKNTLFFSLRYKMIPWNNCFVFWGASLFICFEGVKDSGSVISTLGSPPSPNTILRDLVRGNCMKGNCPTAYYFSSLILWFLYHRNIYIHISYTRLLY